MFTFTSYCKYFNCGFFWEVSLSSATGGGHGSTVSHFYIFIWLIGWELPTWMCNRTLLAVTSCGAW